MTRPKTPRRRWAELGVYVHEWIWRFSHARGDAKFIFLYIGRFITRTKTGEWETTDPPTFKDIEEETDKSASTIARSLKQLESVGDLEVVRGRGAVPRYRLRRQLDLLMDLRPTRTPSRGRLAPVRQTGEAPVTETAHSSHRDGPLQSAGRGVGSVAAAADVSSEVVRTEVLSSSSTEEAHAFLTWLKTEYAKHNRGAAITATFDDALALLAEGQACVPPRDGARVRSMFVAMWTCTLDEDAFIAKAPHRGLVFFRRMAERLDLISRARDAKSAASPDLEAKWSLALSLMKGGSVSDGLYEQWVTPLRFSNCSDGWVTILAPSRPFRDAMPEAVEERIRWAVRTAFSQRMQFMWLDGCEKSEAAS